MMNVDAIWQVFWDTGSPEVFLLYNKIRKAEDRNVSRDKGISAAGDSL